MKGTWSPSAWHYAMQATMSTGGEARGKYDSILAVGSLS